MNRAKRFSFSKISLCRCAVGRIFTLTSNAKGANGPFLQPLIQNIPAKIKLADEKRSCCALRIITAVRSFGGTKIVEIDVHFYASFLCRIHAEPKTIWPHDHAVIFPFSQVHYSSFRMRIVMHCYCVSSQMGKVNITHKMRWKCMQLLHHLPRDAEVKSLPLSQMQRDKLNYWFHANEFMSHRIHCSFEWKLD